jgi:putative effector of murein hydrolase
MMPLAIKQSLVAILLSTARQPWIKYFDGAEQLNNCLNSLPDRISH